MNTRDDHDTDDTHDTGDTFERGLMLFNRGDFLECHEAWEELWLGSTGAEKVFYQGLIQAAVAILHAERGNLPGAVSTWRKARTRLEALPLVHMEIALGEFCDALAEFFTRTLERSADHDLPPRPKIKRHPKAR